MQYRTQYHIKERSMKSALFVTNTLRNVIS